MTEEEKKIKGKPKDLVCQVIVTLYKDRPNPHNVTVTVKPEVLTTSGILGVLQQAYNKVGNRPFVSDKEEDAPKKEEEEQPAEQPT